MMWTLLLPRNTSFLSVLLLKIQYFFIPCQDLVSTCFYSLYSKPGSIRETHSVLTFSLATAILCICTHVLLSRHVRGTSGVLSEPWERLIAVSAISFSLSLLPSTLSLPSYPSLYVFPACSFLSSLPSIPKRVQ